MASEVMTHGIGKDATLKVSTIHIFDRSHLSVVDLMTTTIFWYAPVLWHFRDEICTLCT